MALVKSIVGAEAIYRGSPIYDVDNGEPTYGRVVENAQADVAAINELVSTNYLDNSLSRTAAGRGAPLRLPVVSQSVFWKPAAPTIDATFIQYPVLFSVVDEPGIVDYVFSLVGDEEIGRYSPQVMIHEYTDYTDYPLAESTIMLERTPVGRDEANWNNLYLYEGLRRRIPSGVYVAWFRLRIINDGGNTLGNNAAEGYVTSLHVYRRRGRDQPFLPGGLGQNVRVPTPSGTNPLVFQQMDEALFVDDDGISGWMVDRIDKNINALMEYVTGAPAGTNAAYTHTESAATNPTTSRFLSGTAKGFANEEGISMPVHSVCFGGITSLCEYLIADSSAPELAKQTGWAPFAVADGNVDIGVPVDDPVAVCKTRSFLPDAADMVDVVVLLAQQTDYYDDLTTMRVRVRIGSVVSSYEAVVQIANAPEDSAGVEILGYVELIGLDVSTIRDTAATITVEVYYAGAGTYLPSEIMFRCAVLSLGVWRS
jgi:hypothetical protein